jgi:hypothetical protein
MKNIAKAERPKSAMTKLPLRPCRGSGKAAQTVFNPARRDGNSSIPTVNHFFADSRILTMRGILKSFRSSSAAMQLLESLAPGRAFDA